MNTYRPNLFYALWPNDATRAELASLQTRVQGRLTRPPNLHLTLAFLGPQADALLPILRSILTQLESEPIELQIDRLGYFSNSRIAWAGSHAIPDSLILLQKNLMQALYRKGIPCAAEKSFTPHITLARKADFPSDLPFLPFLWQADQIVLAQSPLPGGEPYYHVLATKQCSKPLANDKLDQQRPLLF